MLVKPRIKLKVPKSERDILLKRTEEHIEYYTYIKRFSMVGYLESVKKYIENCNN